MTLNRVPFMTTSVEGQTAWVNLLYVLRELRQCGVGRDMFECWERSIPREVKRIRLLAVDMEGFSAVDFWRRLGFELVESDPDVTEIVGNYMAKAVHTEAPAPALAPVEAEMVSDVGVFGDAVDGERVEQFEHDMAGVV